MSAEQATTNKDKRGVPRGKCGTCPPGECEEYEYVVGEARSDCAYCGHAATQHERLSNIGSTHAESFSSGDTQTVNRDNASNVSFNSIEVETPIAPSDAVSGLPIITLQGGIDIEEFIKSVQAGSSKPDEIKTDDIPLPERLTPDLDKAFVKKTVPVTDKAVNKLTREIVSTLHQKGLKNSKVVCDKASNKAVRRWSPLKVKGDNTNSGLSRKIRRRFEKLSRTSPSSRTVANTQNDASLEDTLKKMRSDWEDDLRSPTIMKVYMEKLRDSRLVDVVKQSAAEHLRIYPALQLKCVLLRELEVLTSSTFEDMKARWLNKLPKLAEAMETDGLFALEADDDDDYKKTVLVLKHLHLLKVYHKKNKGDEDKKALILEVFPENTPIAQTSAKNKDPPRLMAIDNPEGQQMSFYAFVDTSPLFSTEDPIEAVCLLLATFYAFRISWTPKAKMPLYLLTSILIRPQLIIENVSNNSRFVNFIRGLGRAI